MRIPSVNPHGDPGTDAKNTGETRLAEYLADFFRKLALDVEFHEVEPGRANVIAKFTSRGSKRSLALGPHMDTVSVAGMTIDPFSGDVRDGRVYGRGATDTKGPMAAMLAALANVVRQKSFREGELDVYFCGLMGEESGNDGVRALLKRGFKVDFAVAGEPTDFRVIYAHKGALWFKMITRGKSVHGSMPDKGESAVRKMAEVVRYVLGDYTQSLRLKEGKELGAPTVNVGVIRGGTQINIVPDYCEIEVDRRTLPTEKHTGLLNELRERLWHLAVEVELIRDCPPLHTPPDHPFVQQLAAATGLRQHALGTAPWFCDAGIFSEYGVPAVAFGPGSIAQAHTADEFIEIDTVFTGTAITEKFLMDAARA